MRFRQVHLDFHTSEKIGEIGSRFKKADFQRALIAGHVDSITLFSKCHHGWSYHPTKANEMHPNLSLTCLASRSMPRRRSVCGWLVTFRQAWTKNMRFGIQRALQGAEMRRFSGRRISLQKIPQATEIQSRASRVCQRIRRHQVGD